MKIFGDDYCTIVAETKEQAEKYYLDNVFGELDEDGLIEVDGKNRKIWFPIDMLPEEYRDKTKYPRRIWFGERHGVEITFNEAVRFRKETPPYVLSVSSDLV